MPRRLGYEADEQRFSGAFRVKRSPGVAWHVLGWETEPDEETGWTGQEVRTGRVLAIMVGDDTRHRVDPDDLVPLKRKDYCGGCGQIGCKCDTGGEEDDE